MSLATHDICTGCGVCANVCPKNAIDLTYDTAGFLYPVVNEDKCIHCSLCDLACPALHAPVNTNRTTPTVYACWNKNDDARLSSTSGGVFSVIADHFVNKGGKVFASSMSNDLCVAYFQINNQTEIGLARGSKYTQSKTNYIFRQIAKSLSDDKECFFIGCPCQVTALYAYLREQSTEKLFTADLICHGVSSETVFREYIAWRERQAHKKIVCFSARDKSNGWNNLTVKLIYEDGTTQLLDSIKDPFMRAYFAGLTYRDNCYRCPYASIPRAGDITLGDYFAVETDAAFSTELYSGVSMVLINNEKGRALFDALSGEIAFTARTLEEAVETNACLRTPMKRHKNRERFFSKRSHNMSTLISLYCPYGIKSMIARVIGSRATDFVRSCKRRLRHSDKKEIRK